MDKDVATRLDGMLIGVRGNLAGIASYMKNNLTEEEYSGFIVLVGRSMAATIDISEALYSRFPEIEPKELRPSEK